MTRRSLLLGTLLVIVLCSINYFGHAVMQQASLAAGLFPTAVVGAIVVLVLGLNPLLSRLAGGALRPGELALIAAMGMAACYWPGSVFNNWLNKLAMPAHWQRIQPDWQSAEVMSYVPDASPRLGEGHVQDWPGFARSLLADVDAPWHAAVQSNEPTTLASILQQGRASLEQRRRIVTALNRWIDQGDHASALRARLELVAAYPAHVLPPPSGRGLLPAHGRADPQLTDTLLTGKPGPPSLRQLPWADWMPTLTLWVGFGLLLSAMLLCIALIVHPQWSRREQLAYPVVTFLDELTRPGELRGLPAIVTNRLFWLGLGTIVAIRLINGLNAWFPTTAFLKLPLTVNFAPLTELFPYAARVPGSGHVFTPVFDPIIVAFAFFLSRAASFSLGLAGLVWVMLGAVLIRQGVSVESKLFAAGPVNLINFGAYLGAAGILLYTGRRHYGQVVAAATGLARPQVPGYCVTAARLLAVCGVAAMILLTRYAGLDWPFAFAAIVLILMSMTVLTRIHVETGAMLIHAYWFSFSMLPPLLGFEAVGPTNLIVMALGVLVLTEGTQSALMPYLSNALKLMDQPQRSTPLPTACVLAGVLVLSAVVAAGATFYFGYSRGVATHSLWGFRDQPSVPFTFLAQAIEELRLVDRLDTATAATGLQRLTMIRPDPANLGWVGLGITVTAACAALRLRLPWWPIHPFLFLMLGTFFGYRYAASFLLGWAIKTAVVGLGGERMHRRGRPLMVGIVAGELLAAFTWMGVAWAYHLATGRTPVNAM
jgi:hypothetical protein